jgi:hypothetical protein
VTLEPGHRAVHRSVAELSRLPELEGDLSALCWTRKARFNAPLSARSTTPSAACAEDFVSSEEHIVGTGLDFVIMREGRWRTLRVPCWTA